MESYITTMFWIGIVSIFVRSCFLVGDHPRVTTTNIGSDVLGWLTTAGFLAWASYLKFWA